MERLEGSFFTGSPVDCARDLLGSILVWHGCEGRVVETEANAAEGDPACHTFFRPGARTFVESHEAGTAYVYLNYGVYWLFNVLVKGPAGAGFRAAANFPGVSWKRAIRTSASRDIFRKSGERPYG